MPSRIPKVIYLFWDPNTPMPLLRLLTLVSLKKYNPEYEIIVFTSTNNSGSNTWGTGEHSVPYTGKNYFNLCKYYADSVMPIDVSRIAPKFNTNFPSVYKADIVRLYLLYTYGGYWSDFDILWFKPFEALSAFNLYNTNLLADVDFGTCFANGETGAMFCSSGFAPIKSLYEETLKITSSKNYQVFGPHLFREKFGSATEFLRKYPSTKFCAIESEVFYPIDWTELGKIYLKDPLSFSDKTLGLHWFGGGKESGRFHNSTPLENWANSNIAIIELIKKHKLLDAMGD